MTVAMRGKSLKSNASVAVWRARRGVPQLRAAARSLPLTEAGAAAPNPKLKLAASSVPGWQIAFS
jgi:hypothetical protein